MSRGIRISEDHGGVATIFAVIMVTALMAVIGLVSDGGRLLGARRQAGDLAASAARAGAQQIDLDTLRLTGTVAVSPQAAVDAAQAFLAVQDARGSASVADEVVTVTVSATVDLPLLRLVGLGSRTVTATRQARAAIGIDTAGD